MNAILENGTVIEGREALPEYFQEEAKKEQKNKKCEGGH